jgi:SAM-dependent methyltransferase
LTDVQQRVSGQYEHYYTDGPTEWRRLGAIDKAGNIVALCAGIQVKSVVEIVLARLSELGFGETLHAVEISPSGVDVIRQRAIPRLVQCDLFDGYRIPHESGRFDLAVLSHVIEHVEHPRQLLYEAARIARYVFVEVPTEDMSRHAADYVPDAVGHINFFSPRTIRWLLQSSGLTVVRQKTTNPSKGTYAYAAGRKGVLQFYVKELLLSLAPAVATRHFCYHEALLATASDGTAAP